MEVIYESNSIQITPELNWQAYAQYRMTHVLGQRGAPAEHYCIGNRIFLYRENSYFKEER